MLPWYPPFKVKEGFSGRWARSAQLQFAIALALVPKTPRDDRDELHLDFCGLPFYLVVILTSVGYGLDFLPLDID